MPMFMRRTDPTRCHNCGQRVTPYAAGCWLCGAALDPLRRRRPASTLDRVREGWRALLRRER
jgi:predicted amidophosphoribosyltransferase